MDYDKLFTDNYHTWLELAAFMGNSPEQAYTTYLELAALDEHHFSEELRYAGRITRILCDRFLALSGREKAEVVAMLGGVQ